MHVPEWFARQLAVEFDRQLRVRWSPLRHAFQVERKVRRGSFFPVVPQRGDDEARRIEDGYDFVAEVAPGDRLPCPQCGATTPLPVKRFAEAKCQRCGRAFRASYWPLGDDLLQHLRFIDPMRGGIERVFAAQDAGLEARERTRRRDMHTHTESVWKDGYNRVAGIPSWGYTGREFRG